MLHRRIHFYDQGCFRRRDGGRESDDGRRLRDGCDICHNVLDQTEGGQRVTLEDGKFEHPVNLGGLPRPECDDCHAGRNRPPEGD